MSREKKEIPAKGYLKILLANAVFFGLFAAASLWEQGLSSQYTSVVGLCFFPTALLYGLWFGWYSRKQLGKTLLPCALFFVCFLGFLVWAPWWRGGYVRPEDALFVFWHHLRLSFFASGLFVLSPLAASGVTRALLAKQNPPDGNDEKEDI